MKFSRMTAPCPDDIACKHEYSTPRTNANENQNGIANYNSDFRVAARYWPGQAVQVSTSNSLVKPVFITSFRDWYFGATGPHPLSDSASAAAVEDGLDAASADIASCVTDAFASLEMWEQFGCPAFRRSREERASPHDGESINLFQAMLCAQLPWPKLLLRGDVKTALGLAGASESMLNSMVGANALSKSVSLAVLKDGDVVIRRYLGLSGSRVPFNHLDCSVHSPSQSHQPMPFWLARSAELSAKVTWVTRRPGDRYYFGDKVLPSDQVLTVVDLVSRYSFPSLFATQY